MRSGLVSRTVSTVAARSHRSARIDDHGTPSGAASRETPVTSSPSRAHSGARCEPTKPDAPVISTRIARTVDDLPPPSASTLRGPMARPFATAPGAAARLRALTARFDRGALRDAWRALWWSRLVVVALGIYEWIRLPLGAQFVRGAH